MAVARIRVKLKPTVLDAQGAQVRQALHSLGFEAVRDVRMGRYIEVELPDDWPPCPQCGSTDRFASATMKHRNVGFFCAGRDEHRLKWDNGDGTTGLWMPHELFWPGGRFEGLIPPHFLGNPKAKSADRRLDINERRKDWIHNEQMACASCHMPPMRDAHDRGKLLYWLKDYHGDVFADVLAFVNVAKPRPKLSTWFDALFAAHNMELLGTITERVRSSYLQAEHSIPRAVLKELWGAWDGDMRKIATGTLAFGFCRGCNNGKHARLPSRAELLRRHIQVNHGNEVAARTDRKTWAALERVLDALDAHRATQLSETDAETA